MHSILVVDDELSIRESFSLILEGKYRVILAASGEAALKAVSDQKLDMAYLDIRMPGMDGIETLTRVREIDPDLEVIMVTAVNDVQNASKAIKIGARDYVVKPFDVDHILKLTEQILSKKSIQKEKVVIKKKGADLVGLDNIQKAVSKIRDDKKVLILGEPGTEKEIVASIIHEMSGRSKAQFMTTHLSSLIHSKELTALFLGRGKGSTTAELTGKTGLFEQLRSGTLFIDNLEALPGSVSQAIVDGEFSRDGSQTKIEIETRLIAGAMPGLAEKNRPLFDLFSERVINIPPLRERNRDIPLLIKYFCNKCNDKYDKEISFSPDTIKALASYQWPGNTQELGCLVERYVLSLNKRIVEIEDLPLDVLLRTTQGTGSEFILKFEKEYIQKVYEEKGKDKAKTASFLGITPTVLEVKL
ncbi:MAG: sigma-54 dependent transcriptional regulator [Candidatus Margulisiibacteriota bacterium]|nr:sigma-54 dependent transcriptional regulator [Candidatus Margulisiibacteriota bacterium]